MSNLEKIISIDDYKNARPNIVDKGVLDNDIQTEINGAYDTINARTNHLAEQVWKFNFANISPATEDHKKNVLYRTPIEIKCLINAMIIQTQYRIDGGGQTATGTDSYSGAGISLSQTIPERDTIHPDALQELINARVLGATNFNHKCCNNDGKHLTPPEKFFNPYYDNYNFGCLSQEQADGLYLKKNWSPNFNNYLFIINDTGKVVLINKNDLVVDIADSEIDKKINTHNNNLNSHLLIQNAFDSKLNKIKNIKVKDSFSLITINDLIDTDKKLTTQDDLVNFVNLRIAEAMINTFHYKGSKQTQADLPTTNNKIGDIWFVIDDSLFYAWNGTSWDQLGGSVSGITAITEGTYIKIDKTNPNNPIINFDSNKYNTDIISGLANKTNNFVSPITDTNKGLTQNDLPNSLLSKSLTITNTDPTTLIPFLQEMITIWSNGKFIKGEIDFKNQQTITLPVVQSWDTTFTSMGSTSTFGNTTQTFDTNFLRKLDLQICLGTGTNIIFLFYQLANEDGERNIRLAFITNFSSVLALRIQKELWTGNDSEMIYRGRIGAKDISSTPTAINGTITYWYLP